MDILQKLKLSTINREGLLLKYLLLLSLRFMTNQALPGQSFPAGNRGAGKSCRWLDSAFGAARFKAAAVRRRAKSCLDSVRWNTRVVHCLFMQILHHFRNSPDKKYLFVHVTQ